MQSSEFRSQILILRLALLELQKELLSYMKEDFDRESGRVSQPSEWLQILMISERFHWMKELTSLIIDVDLLSELDEVTEENSAIVRQEVDRILLNTDQSQSEFNKNYITLLRLGAPLIELHNKLKAANSSLPEKPVNPATATEKRSKWHEEHRSQSRKRRN